MKASTGLFAIAVLATFAPTGEVAAQSQSVKMHIEGHLVIVPVRISGTGPHPFILDTGSTTSMIDHRLAADLKLPLRGSRPLTYFSGKKDVPVVRVETLEFGPVTEVETNMLAFDLIRVFKLDVEVGGILGQNVLSKLDYLLDYDRRSVRFDVPADDPVVKGPPTPLIRKQLRDFVAVRMEGSDRELVLLLDSGSPVVLFLDDAATGSLIVGTPGREHRPAVESNSLSRRVLEAVHIPHLLLWGWTLADLPAAVTSNKKLEDWSEDGVLPTALFRAVYFNHSQGYVVLQPRAKYHFAGRR